MFYIAFHPLKRPAEKQADLLLSTLDLHGVGYNVMTMTGNPTDQGQSVSYTVHLDSIESGSTIITDCFIIDDTDPGSGIAQQIIKYAAKNGCRIVFYYPSESYATLSASFERTADMLQKHNVPGYLIKCGNWDIPGFVKNYNFPEFFAWIINSEFNRARLAYTHMQIDNAPKTHKFLFLNGAQRSSRQHLFDLYQASGLLESSIWSYRGSKSATGIGPDRDWQNPFVHPDFNFYAYYPGHFYNTELSVVSETTQMEFFPTEKIYKSLMLGHAFALYGGKHSLKYLHELGFKTFNNVIDESYDNVEYPIERAKFLVDALRNCDDNITAKTQEARHHNRLNFYKVANSIYLKLLEVLQEVDSTCILNESFTVTDSILNEYFLN